MHDDYDFSATFDFSDSDWKAIDQALKTPGKSVALVNFRPLLSEEGVLSKLKAKGYTITTPAEAQP